MNAPRDLPIPLPLARLGVALCGLVLVALAGRCLQLLMETGPLTVMAVALLLVFVAGLAGAGLALLGLAAAMKR